MKKYRITCLVLFSLFFFSSWTGAEQRAQELYTNPLVSSVLWDVTKWTSPKELQEETYRGNFITDVLQKAIAINQNISQKRKKLEKLYIKRQQTSLSASEISWVNQLANQYGVKNFDINHAKTRNLLLFRVDTMPLSLVVAQAIYESDWGQSRFARQGNNYFGQHCYRTGCGLIPSQRVDGDIFEVQRFNSMSDSIAAYINNLNTGEKYIPLRNIRAALRSQHWHLSGLTLADGLTHYSEQPTYVQNIKKIIQKYNLDRYDLA